MAADTNQTRHYLINFYKFTLFHAKPDSEHRDE